MSASSRLRFGVVAAAFSCLLVTYVTAEPNVGAGQSSTDPSATGQTDRSTTQQADPSTASSTDRAIGEATQNRTNYRRPKRLQADRIRRSIIFWPIAS